MPASGRSHYLERPMSVFLEPREVERPFRKRWVRITLELMWRSPVRFSLAIAVLSWLDLSVLRFVGNLVIPRVLFDWLGLLLVPVILAVITAIARGADDARETWTAFRGFARGTLWMGTLGWGATVVVIEWITGWLFQSNHSIHYVHEAGGLLESFGASGLFVDCLLGLCYIPLLVFEPELSTREVRELSRTATEVNGNRRILWLLAAVAGIATLIDLIPTYAIGDAALLVFLGTLGYVAYRDIFERRSSNLPVAAHAIPPAPALQSAIGEARYLHLLPQQ